MTSWITRKNILLDSNIIKKKIEKQTFSYCFFFLFKTGTQKIIENVL